MHYRLAPVGGSSPGEEAYPELRNHQNKIQSRCSQPVDTVNLGGLAGFEGREALADVDRGAELAVDAVDPGVEPTDFGE